MTTQGNSADRMHIDHYSGSVRLDSIGVIGAGVMGVGVAQALAQSGLRTLLIDISNSILDAARRKIANNIRFQRLFQKNYTSDPQEVLSRIEVSASYDILEQVDFVIENITEKVGIKAQVYARMDTICPPHCIFAANTSAIPIARISAMTTRPSQVLGMHFMNPVPFKATVEVIRGYRTGDGTMVTAKRLLALMGKECIIVNDSPGFVSNRVLMLMINEAIFLAQEKVASVDAIDEIFRSCLGHKMGPLETADLIGLDTILFSIEVLFEEFKDDKFRPCPLLRQMVADGLYGRKSGRGFYNHAE